MISSLFYKIEKRIDIDLKHYLNSTSWLNVGQLITFSFGTLGAIIFARFLQPETYGLYRYILALFGIFTLFTLPGITQAVMRASALQPHLQNIIPLALTRQIKYAIFGSTLLIGIAFYYFLMGNEEIAFALLLCSVFLPFFETFTVFLSYYIGREQYQIHTKYLFISRGTGFLSTALAVYYSESIIFILISYFLPVTLINFFLLRLTLRKMSVSPEKRLVEDTLTLGKHLSIMQILGTISTHLDKILLWHFLGPTSVAIYYFAIMIPLELKAFIKNVGSVALPKFAKNEFDYSINKLNRKIIYFIIICIFITFFYIISAPILIQLLFPTYIDSIIYSQIYALTIPFVPGVLYTNLFMAHMKVKELYFMKIMNPLLLSCGYIVLIPLYGIIGALVTILITNIISIIFWFLYSRMMTKNLT